jgi:hypothetical protein
MLRVSKGFTHPRANAALPRLTTASDLGLGDDQVNDLADFIENALYDPAFVHSIQTEELESEALKLSPPERARLAALLLNSLEALTDDENAQLWAEEATVAMQPGTTLPLVLRVMYLAMREYV